MNQPIPNDDAKIVNAQPANHTQGKCFKPWVATKSFGVFPIPLR